MWVVYVLKSERTGWLYIGLTCDIRRRLLEHNRGYNRSTRGRGPFRVIHTEKFSSRPDARRREVYLKSGQGREFLRALPG
jgi:putative endonuclease